MNAYDLNRALTVVSVILLALLTLALIHLKMSLPTKRTMMISEDMLNDNFLRYVQ